MTSWINPEIFKRQGFREFENGEFIKASFYTLYVYKVKGINLSEDYRPIVFNGTLKNKRYKICLGNDVNEVSNELFQDNYTDDLPKWIEDKKASPPYMLILLGPTDEHTTNEGLIKVTDTHIETYDSFKSAIDECMKLEQGLIPQLVSSLKVQLITESDDFDLERIDAVRYGLTPDNTTLHNFKFETSTMELTLNKKIDSTLINQKIRNTLKTTNKIDNKAIKFFHLAENESDVLKSFLYYFLSIEIYSHDSFKKLKQSDLKFQLRLTPKCVANSLDSLIINQLNRVTNLSERFILCAGSMWENINDNDVNTFKSLKKIRDNIAHGSINEPEKHSLKVIKNLAVKLFNPENIKY